MLATALGLMLTALSSCMPVTTSDPQPGPTAPPPGSTNDASRDVPAYIRVAQLADDDVTAVRKSFAGLRTLFRQRNPGYDIHWHAATAEVAATDAHRVAFVQRGPARATVGATTSDTDAGDIILLRPNDVLASDGPIDLLVFTVPAPLPDDLPAFIRPDWDERITDTPGGCATETGAYRRILLTWLPTVGPYVYHGLNAHRVRIMDSFTHYHPLEGGFDEFYLVQMVQPKARVLVSDATAHIEKPETVTRDEAASLIDAVPLTVGDLVYLPRGVVHRGVDGVLAQVITTPGFRPGAEIGVDHHLRAIAERTGAELPYHEAASERPVVR